MADKKSKMTYVTFERGASSEDIAAQIREMGKKAREKREKEGKKKEDEKDEKKGT